MKTGSPLKNINDILGEYLASLINRSWISRGMACSHSGWWQSMQVWFVGEVNGLSIVVVDSA